MSVVRLVPAPWNIAGLKNTMSPFDNGTCTWCSRKYSMNSGRRHAKNPCGYLCECGRYIVGPDSTGMSQWAAAPCSVRYGDIVWACSGYCSARSSVMNPTW